EPHKTFGAVNLEAETGSGSRHGSQVSGHSVLEFEDHRFRVVRIDRDYAAEAKTIDRIDLAEKIDHAVDGVRSQRRQAAARRFIAVSTTRAGLEIERIAEGHRRFRVQ